MEAIVIDPGDEVSRILAQLEGHGLKVRSILHTHTHIDHIGGTDLWQGDYDQEIVSIKKKLILLGDETKVVPGHGPVTTNISPLVFP